MKTSEQNWENTMTSKQQKLIENYVRRKVRSMLNEADRVEFTEFPEDKQNTINNIAKHFNATIDTKSAFDGIHGYIITLNMKETYSAMRMDKETLKFLSSSNIRWIEPQSNKSFTIGL